MLMVVLEATVLASSDVTEGSSGDEVVATVLEVVVGESPVTGEPTPLVAL